MRTLESHPSSKAMKSFILENKERLVNCIDITTDLTLGLRSRGILTQSQFRTLNDSREDYSSIGLMLDFIHRRLDENTEVKLVAVLEEAQHKHVANFIRGLGQRTQEFGNDWPLGDSEIQALDDNLAQLNDLIDSKNGLLESMLAAGCITGIQRDRYAKSEYGNALLVTKVRCSSEAVFLKFIDCLKETKQHHVVSILKPELAQDVRPLNDEERSCIVSNTVGLIDNIRIDVVFLAELVATDCITGRQRESIESLPIHADKCTSLLDMLRRGSQKDLLAFIECLRNTKQASLIDFF